MALKIQAPVQTLSALLHPKTVEAEIPPTANEVVAQTERVAALLADGCNQQKVQASLQSLRGKTFEVLEALLRANAPLHVAFSKVIYEAFKEGETLLTASRLQTAGDAPSGTASMDLLVASYKRLDGIAGFGAEMARSSNLPPERLCGAYLAHYVELSKLQRLAAASQEDFEVFRLGAGHEVAQGAAQLKQVIRQFGQVK